MQDEKVKMTQLKWENYKNQRIKTFEDENSVKMERHKMSKAYRAKKAREKRAAKVKALVDVLPK